MWVNRGRWLALVFAAGLTGVGPAPAAPATHWRFEGVGGPPVRRSDDAPGPFVYDPQAGRSYPNTGSAVFAGTDKATDAIELAVQLPAAGGFTLEMFIKPDSVATRTVLAASKQRLGPDAGEFALGARFLPQWNQAYWSGFATEPGGEPLSWSTGHYVTNSRLCAPNPAENSPGNLVWRHFAMVYDAEALTLTAYLDHWQAARQQLSGPMTWDAGPLRIGGGRDGDGFAGRIDEVRLTDRVLGPAGFLRRVDTPLEGVDFHSPGGKLPAGMVVDVRACFGAVGDGVHDDTAAFQRAFDELADKVPGGWYVLRVPAGTYLISDTIRHRRFFVVQGDGRDKTVIRLRDRSAGFQDKGRPKVVYGCGWSEWGEWGNGAGNHIGVYLFDFSIDTGSGNPGAVGLDHHSNNIGTVRDVGIRSGDGEGLIGLSFVRPWPGPALIKDVIVDGFDHGVKIDSQEYSMTFENLTLRRQKVAGIVNNGNIIGIRRLRSDNRVPAIVAPGANSMVALFDSELRGGDPAVPAIESGGGLYVRNLRVDGYREAVHKRILVDQKTDTWEEKSVPGPRVGEFVGDAVSSVGGDATGALMLPIEDTPELPWGDPRKDWAGIDEFADDCDGEDWAPALEAAFASGAKTIWFPHSVAVGRTVRLRGPVERLIGNCRTGIGWLPAIEQQMAARFEAAGDLNLDQRAKEAPAVVFAEPAAGRTVVIERMSVAGLRHESPATLVFRHGGPEWFTNGPGCGKLFMEDLGANCFRFDHPQKVWVRQWNPEAHQAGPCIVSRGATLWVLGFKTEYESSKLWAFDGARTEIFGSFIYPIGEIPPERPVFRNVDSRMALQYGASIYQSNHKVQILEQRNGVETAIGAERLKWAGSRARMDLYVSP